MTKGNKRKIVFAHSAGPQYGAGKGSYDLVQYLKSKLAGDFEIMFPKIRKPGSPTYEKYKEMFASLFPVIEEPVILIGHSLGGSTLLKYLSEEKPPISISGLFLISTPFWKSNMKEFQLKKNFQNALKKVSAIYLYHSKNDTDAPIENLDFYKAAFPNAIVHELPGNQHVFTKGLPALVSDIKKI